MRGTQREVELNGGGRNKRKWSHRMSGSEIKHWCGTKVNRGAFYLGVNATCAIYLPERWKGKRTGYALMSRKEQKRNIESLGSCWSRSLFSFFGLSSFLSSLCFLVLWCSTRLLSVSLFFWASNHFTCSLWRLLLELCIFCSTLSPAFGTLTFVSSLFYVMPRSPPFYRGSITPLFLSFSFSLPRTHTHITLHVIFNSGLFAQSNQFAVDTIRSTFLVFVCILNEIPRVEKSYKASPESERTGLHNHSHPTKFPK